MQCSSINATSCVTHNVEHHRAVHSQDRCADMSKAKEFHQDLHCMESDDINQAALTLLDRLLQRCTMLLVTDLTGITRTTLYKWLNESLPLDAMSTRDSAWFILMCETSPKLIMLLKRAPLEDIRKARHLVNIGESNAES